MACGLPAFPALAKPRRLIQSDQFAFPNGSTITYKCDDTFTPMKGEFKMRTCVNGSWIGEIGKCHINYGKNFKLSYLDVYINEPYYGWVGYYDFYYYYNPSYSSSSLYPNDYRSDDEYITQTYSFFKYESNCPNFTVEGKKQKWQFSVSTSKPVTFVTFGFQFDGSISSDFDIDNENDLANFPLTLKLRTSNYYYTSNSYIECQLESYRDHFSSQDVSWICSSNNLENKKTSLYNYGDSKVYVDTIYLFVDPTKFETNTSYIRFCSASFYYASSDCGTPDRPKHAKKVTIDPVTKTASFECEPGYEIVGENSVRCADNGVWLDEFPKCRLIPNYCDGNFTMPYLTVKFENLVDIDGVPSIVKDTIAMFFCEGESIQSGSHILVGPRTVMCMSNGLWSGTPPFCDGISFEIHNSLNFMLHFNFVIVSLSDERLSRSHAQSTKHLGSLKFVYYLITFVVLVVDFK